MNNEIISAANLAGKQLNPAIAQFGKKNAYVHHANTVVNNFTVELKYPDAISHISEKDLKSEESETSGLISSLDGAINKFGINRFIDCDYSDDLLSKQQLLNCNSFIEEMEDVIGEHWLNQNDLYKNVVTFVCLVDDYEEFLQKYMIQSGKSNYVWNPKYQSEEFVNEARNYRMALCSIYKYQLTNGRSLLILPNVQLETPLIFSAEDETHELSTGFFSLLVGFWSPTYTSSDQTEGYFDFFSRRAFNDMGADNELNMRLAKLDDNEKNLIMSHPTLFATDQGPEGDSGKDAVFVGYVTDIKHADSRNLRIYFTFYGEFNESQLAKHRVEFDLSDWELSRTHWVMKEMDLSELINRTDIDISPVSIRNEENND